MPNTHGSRQGFVRLEALPLGRFSRLASFPGQVTGTPAFGLLQCRQSRAPNKDITGQERAMRLIGAEPVFDSADLSVLQEAYDEACRKIGLDPAQPTSHCTSRPATPSPEQS